MPTMQLLAIQSILNYFVPYSIFQSSERIKI